MTLRIPIAAFLLGISIATAFYKVTGAPRPHALITPVADTSNATGHTITGSRARIEQPTTAAAPRVNAVASAAELYHLNDVAAEMRERAIAAEEQLALAEGRPVAWPHDAPKSYKQEAVERQLKEFVEDRGLAKVKSVECTEYPCVEVLELSDGSPQAMEGLHASLNEMIKRYYDGPVALMISSSRSATDGVTLVGVSVVPNDDEVKTRTHHRTTEALGDYTP